MCNLAYAVLLVDPEQVGAPTLLHSTKHSLVSNTTQHFM
jgi:hypothetical protein